MSDRKAQVRRLWTTEETEYLIHHYATRHLKDIAADLDRSWTVVQQRRDILAKRGLLDKAQRCYQRPWSEEDEDYLNDHWGVLADAAVAGHLRRSITACAMRAKRLGLSRHMAVLTARDVGRIFGVDAKTILTWQRRGWLVGKRAGYDQGPHRVWNFDVATRQYQSSAVEDFIRAMPWAFDVALMPKGEYHTNLAREVLAADPWLSSAEAAALAGVGINAISRWCCREGLPCKHRPKLGTQAGPWAGLLVIRKADFLAWLAEYRATVHERKSAASKARRGRRSLKEAA